MHLKGPRGQRHKTYCGVLRDGTKGGENHVRDGSGELLICGMAAEGTGIHTSYREDCKVWRLAGRPACMCLCVSVCEAV